MTDSLVLENQPVCVAKKPKLDWKEVKKSRWPYLFISPFFILYAIFGAYPTLYSFYLSLVEWKGLGEKHFVGLDNYILIFKDKLFWHSMGNGVIMFFLYVPILTFLALTIAVILNSKRVRGFRFFRTVIFLPYIMNMVAAGFTFRLLLNEKYGLINVVLEMLKLPTVPWLESVWGGRISLGLLIIWAWLGYNMVIMLAGLQTISSELNEAAYIDGASPVTAFFYITIPLMKPVILFTVVLSTMGSFNLFTEIWTLTNGGGPMNATLTPIVYIFNQAFTNFRLGYASAGSYVYFLVMFILTLTQIRFFGNDAD